MTEPVERRGGQFKEMELKVHPELKRPLTELCSDPNTTIVILSGSDTVVLEEVNWHTFFDGPLSIKTALQPIQLNLISEFRGI